jgi:hypothetical protein
VGRGNLDSRREQVFRTIRRCSSCWLIVRVLTRLLVFPSADDGKDLEILVLRQQLRVLRRKTGRPKFTAVSTFSEADGAAESLS